MFHHTRTRHRKYGPWLLGSATALRRRGCECLANPVAAASAKFTILQNSSQSNTVLPLLRVNNWGFSVLRRNKSKTICRTLRSPLPRTMAMTWGGEAWKILKGIATQPFCAVTNWNQPFKGIRIGILISWLWGAEVMTFRFCSAPAARWSRISIKLVTVFCFRPWGMKSSQARLQTLVQVVGINKSIDLLCLLLMYLDVRLSLRESVAIFRCFGIPKRWASEVAFLEESNLSAKCEALPLDHLTVKASKVHPGIQTDISLATSFHVSNLGLTSSRRSEKDMKVWLYDGSFNIWYLQVSTFSLSLKPSKPLMDQTRLVFLAKIIKFAQSVGQFFALHMTLHIPTNDSRHIFEAAPYRFFLRYPSQPLRRVLTLACPNSKVGQNWHTRSR